MITKRRKYMNKIKDNYENLDEYKRKLSEEYNQSIKNRNVISNSDKKNNDFSFYPMWEKLVNGQRKEFNNTPDDSFTKAKEDESRNVGYVQPEWYGEVVQCLNGYGITNTEIIRQYIAGTPIMQVDDKAQTEVDYILKRNKIKDRYFH